MNAAAAPLPLGRRNSVRMHSLTGARAAEGAAWDRWRQHLPSCRSASCPSPPWPALPPRRSSPAPQGRTVTCQHCATPAHTHHTPHPQPQHTHHTPHPQPQHRRRRVATGESNSSSVMCPEANPTPLRGPTSLSAMTRASPSLLKCFNCSLVVVSFSAKRCCVWCCSCSCCCSCWQRFSAASARSAARSAMSVASTTCAHQSHATTQSPPVTHTPPPAPCTSFQGQTSAAPCPAPQPPASESWFPAAGGCTRVRISARSGRLPGRAWSRCCCSAS